MSDESGQKPAGGTFPGSDELLRRVVDGAPIILSAVDRDGVFTLTAGRSLATLGSTPGAAVGWTVFERFPDSPEVHAAVRRALAGETFTLELELAGAWFETRYAPLLGPEGEVAGAIAISTDISERRRAERSLQRSEARFRALTDRAPDGIVLVRDGTIVYANAAFATLVGVAAHDLAKRPLRDVVHPDDLAAFVATGGGPGDGPALCEVRLVRADGACVDIERASLAAELDEGTAALVLVRDVTERKQRMSKLMQEDRLLSLGTLGAGVAHEVNNPLAYLMANLELLARRLPKLADELRAGDETAVRQAARIDEACGMVRVAREGADRIRAVVEDLRRLSAPDRAPQVPVDVVRVLESSVQLASDEIRRRARLVTDYEPVAPVVASEARLGQVFLNLLVNASEALPDRPSDENEIRVRTRTVGSHVLVSVADNGEGIPREQMRRLFDPFFTTKPNGTGLGLPISHGIVTSLGGDIEVESEPGRGTTFHVRLPARVDLAGEAPER